MKAASPAPALATPQPRLHLACPINAAQHTMSAPRLLRYLQIKVHHLIQERDWASICVLGDYDRGCVISANEKPGKLFNWHRPTAEAHGDDLLIKCYPSVDYVRHYALIIATYLNMHGSYRGQVSYVLPSEHVCQAAATRLDVDPSADHLVVLGWGLPDLARSTQWVPGHGYAWQRADADGLRVLYLGFLHSIWGDAAGRIVSRLALLGARRIVYVGKVGSLDPRIVPNTTLATGNCSLTASGPVTWQDFFSTLAASQPGIRSGVHVTSPSPLLEGKTWLASQHGTSFVDPEIGHMGQAANAAGIEFGYLHVISNNLARPYPADLSNERLGSVIHDRACLLARIHEIIQLRLQTASAPAVASRKNGL